MTAFSASRKLVAYAETKLGNLQGDIASHLDRHIEITAEHLPHLTSVIADFKEPIPDSLGFQVVETVGHIRSALDKLIAEIVIMNNRGQSGVGFPFGGLAHNGTPEPFPSPRHNSLKAKLTPKQWENIISIKPFPGGNDTLWGINRIANATKHGAGLVEFEALAVPELAGGSFTPYLSPLSRFPEMPGEIHIFPNISSSFKGKCIIMNLVSVKGQLALKKSLRLVFSDIAPVQNKDVLMVINKQIQEVSCVIDRFESAI